jgi:hypothetical protein
VGVSCGGIEEVVGEIMGNRMVIIILEPKFEEILKYIF